jgi:hypothetical protein
LVYRCVCLAHRDGQIPLHRRVDDRLSISDVGCSIESPAEVRRAELPWRRKRVTGADLEHLRAGGSAAGRTWNSVQLENGSIGYLFGDTYGTPFWNSPGDTAWRSPVMLRSNDDPGPRTESGSTARRRSRVMVAHRTSCPTPGHDPMRPAPSSNHHPERRREPADNRRSSRIMSINT